jgi:hypothetical protein
MLVQRLLDFIEKKRVKPSKFWLIILIVKDFLWRIYSYFCHKFNVNNKKPDFGKFKNVTNYYKISFCTTCMNRLRHIKKTLIKNIENNIDYPNVEFVLLDYNSNDGLKDWVYKNCKDYLNKGILKYYRTEDPKYFHMSHAKNMAHNISTGDILCNLDADNFTKRDFAFYLNFKFIENQNIIITNSWNSCRDRLSDFGGRICISKDNFIKLNGYDENFIGWGYEDLDFKHRAFEIGIKPTIIHSYFLKSLWHPDNMRDENMPISKNESTINNRELFVLNREKVKFSKD